ncbi:ABC transporter permease [Virgibacillus ihumii]|uniref:ABC transporter permease n=1 Tax=Virgibacillus ihumii TaxID=2686091 RepID=UPI00157CDCC6|nr:ABC transporter permease [Virgibacillus ihumii]
MKSIIETRIIHWKKQGFSLVFWLLFPIIATWVIIAGTNSLANDSKIPVGIVLEEQSDASLELVEEVKSAPLVRTAILSEDEALYKLRKHDLDSVFIIHEGFQEKVLQNERNKLITGYQSDLSFAFTPVKEMILSYVQQETGRAKAAFVVQQLESKYNGNKNWPAEDIIEKSKEIQQEENLLTTSFSFSDPSMETGENRSLFSIWGIWGLLSILSALFIFDWVIKEKNAKAAVRFAFTRTPLKSYLMQNFILYVILFLIVDVAAVVSFYLLFGEWISILNLIIFRIWISMGAFLLAQLFSNTYVYYMASFGLILITGICSGAILPSGIISNWTWFEQLNPLRPLIKGEFISLWTIMIIVIFTVWLLRKEKSDASYM